MSTFKNRLHQIEVQKDQAQLLVYSLGRFDVFVNGQVIAKKTWGRDKTIQLFQFMITSRHRHSLHKEQIINRLWEESGSIDGDRDFKVALHGINKALEPDRPPRTEAKYVLRQGISYQLNQSLIWLDAQAVEDYIALANEALPVDQSTSISAYRAALDLHQGIYLPNRSYEDWSSEERERIQVLILSAHLSLAELLLLRQPLETVRLTQKALAIDNTWEDAYQLQMKAYLARGNRPAAMKTFNQCVRILDKEFGLDPLPETQALYDSIILAPY